MCEDLVKLWLRNAELGLQVGLLGIIDFWAEGAAAQATEDSYVASNSAPESV